MRMPSSDPAYKELKVTRMQVGLSRLGSTVGSARVQWATFDNSAVAGRHYNGVKPTWVTFAPGETHVEVEIEVVPLKSFDGTVEFGVHILKESAEGCTVGKYLHTATVKIIDLTVFPSDLLAKLAEGGRREHIAIISASSLIKEFLGLCWANRRAREGVLKRIAAFQVTAPATHELRCAAL